MATASRNNLSSFSRVTLSHRGRLSPFRSSPLLVARCELQNASFAVRPLNTDVQRGDTLGRKSLKTGDCRRELEVMAITPPLRPSEAREKRPKCPPYSSALDEPSLFLSRFFYRLALFVDSAIAGFCRAESGEEKRGKRAAKSMKIYRIVS